VREAGLKLISSCLHGIGPTFGAKENATAHKQVLFLSALAAMLAFVSSWVLVPFAVFTWGAPVALLLLWTGWLLGGAAMYAIGRFLGRPAVWWLVRSDSLVRYEQRFARHMPFYIVLLVQLSLPSEIPGYLLGLVRYSFVRYLAAYALRGRFAHARVSGG
jgi:uncharacterized membrane protein YdjX (TVP38/TMEM64 family)